MKKECEQTRKQFRRYLRGHVFAAERKRIERHLASCPLCASEYQSLKRSDETTQFLKEITPPEGVVQKVKTGVSGLSALKKLFYRPLWILAAVALGVIAFRFVITPYFHGQEQEWHELTAPSAPVEAPSAQPAPAPPGAAQSKQTGPAAAPDAAGVAPLAVTIAADDEQAAVRRINDVMRGHGVLRSKRFSDTVKEISGELTAKELLTFFSRIESVGRISYSRARFEEFPGAQPMPFVLKLKAAAPRSAQAQESPVRAPGPGEAAAPKPAPGASSPASELPASRPASETPPAR